MAISSWMIWGRSLRTSRSHRGRHDNEDDCVQFDLSKDLKENIKEALTNLCQRYNVTSIKKLAYLNAFVRLISESDTSDYGYNVEEVLCCLRVGLVHEATQVRAAALRAVRYMLKNSNDVVIMNKLQYPYFVARSMDVNLRNEVERMQALRLVRRILVLAPKQLSPALARSLVSLTSGGIEERDRGFRVFLATLCEVGVLNANLLINCGGLGVLARAAMSGQSSVIVECVVGVLLQLLTNPQTRKNVSLLCLASPYCEIDSSGVERSKMDRLQSYIASKYALISVLRSYPGILHFCHPNENAGLKAVIDILYVDQVEVRGAILELLYELLCLPLPMWTDEPDVALAAVDPSRFRESWKLGEGFIAAEGRNILPSLMLRRPNITEIHLALLVYVLLECGLHRALAETIVTSDTFISVRAAVLLGALLHLAHSLLPPEVCDLSPSLPNLLDHASAGKHQALTAVAILERMHAMMRRKPTPASLFLDRLLQAGSWLRPTLTKRNRPSIRNWLKRESPQTSLLKDTQVLSCKDALLWNWPIVRSILRSREDSLRILHNSDHKLFIKRLVRYFKPSSNNYSRIEIATNTILAREATLAGCDLINCLLELHEPEGMKLLNELIGDIAEQVSAIRTAQSAHDCLFSPRHVSTTCCQKYFLFLGQLSHSAKGTVVLKAFNLLEKMQDLAIATNHDCYIKLIISGLDYSRDGPNRKVLRKIAAEANLESTRLYATQFLRLILRTKMSDAHQWAILVLSERLSDNSRTVALSALEILDEACEEPEYLEAFLQQVSTCRRDWTKWLENLGDHGYLLKIRLFSLRSAFSSVSSPLEELERWIKNGGFAERYVGLVEAEIHDSLTRRQRGENGNYLRRTSSAPILPRDVFVPPHLIGQFVQHDLGMQILSRRNVIQRFTRVIQRFKVEYSAFGYNGPSGSVVNTSLSGAQRRNSLTTEDTYFMFEESETDGNAEPSSRLETIIDSEVMDCTSAAKKSESFLEIRRKLSIDDSRRTTPERSWKEQEPRDESASSLSTNVEAALLKVKAALWLLGHAGTSAMGVEQLNNLAIIELITSLAETCPYYSVRATAMYTLSLIATTRNGADLLTTLDWPCIRHRRGDHWQVVQPTVNPFPTPSPTPVQRHHRSLSDGKPELPEPIARRTRNRSESAATDFESRRCALLERGETPSPVSSIHRLSQQDAEGYAKLRSLQRHRRPSYSQSSLEMYSLDERLSSQSLSEYESSRSWMGDSVLTPTPPPLPPEQDDSNIHYMGICLPQRLAAIFPCHSQTTSSGVADDNRSKPSSDATTEVDEESCSEYDTGEHGRMCLVCYNGKGTNKKSLNEADAKIQREILRYTQRLANPILYRHSRQTLLRLRQRHPDKFQDTCLFSEVAVRLGSDTYRLPARRFLQELFLDSTFDSIYTEPLCILNMSKEAKKEDCLEPAVSDTLTDNPKKSSNNLEMKINGRLNLSDIQAEQLAVVTEETVSGEAQSIDSKNKTKQHISRIPEQQRLSDEKIIADILKPEERLRLPKNAEKMFKVTDTNTAISLD